MVLAEKESLLVSVVRAGKLVQELVRAMGGCGGGQQHFAQGGGGDAVKFKAAGPAIRKALESQIR